MSECLTDPQSSEGAEQVTAHSKMSQPIHNSSMCFPHQTRQDIREERKVLASWPGIMQRVSIESENLDNYRAFLTPLCDLDAGLSGGFNSECCSDKSCLVVHGQQITVIQSV